MTSADLIEYRIAHLRERLAREDIAELGLQIEAHGTHAVLRGSVCSDASREAVLRAATEELDGVEWHEDLTVNHMCPPDHSEELL
ncbi:hypothetical protein [Streptomyces sp. NPDC051000]|uniref:hypothetical protein n=1 Tax=unclassified Streptomyces TaxID=2593676 RepID=UPI0033FE5109